MSDERLKVTLRGSFVAPEWLVEQVIAEVSSAVEHQREVLDHIRRAGEIICTDHTEAWAIL
jgi:hypothetical protein